MLADNWPSLVVWIVLCLATGTGAWWLTRGEIEGWYGGLRKPDLNPPDWMFAPVWNALYILMGVAAWMVWVQRANDPISAALTIFLVQLFLNFCWSVIFFRWHQPAGAFVEIVMLWLAIAGTIVAFSAVRVWPGILLIPYLAWVSFATYLNGAIWRLNRVRVGT